VNQKCKNDALQMNIFPRKLSSKNLGNCTFSCGWKKITFWL